MKKNLIIAAASLILFAGWLDPFKDSVSEGNKNFHDKKYSEALKKYDEAETHAPTEESKKALSMNRGTARYMEGDADKAAAEFSRAVGAEDTEVKKRALFNAGNAHLKAGREKEAFEAYRQALRIDPGYDRAKKNIEYIIKKREQDNKQQQNKDSGKDDKQKGDAGQKEGQMNPDQAKNLLDSMKNNPVRKQKGSGNGNRFLDKFW